MKRKTIAKGIAKRCLALGMAVSMAAGNAGMWMSHDESTVMAAERRALPTAGTTVETPENLIFNGHLNLDSAGWDFRGDRNVIPQIPAGQNSIKYRADYSFDQESAIPAAMQQNNGQKIVLSFGCTYELKFDVTSNVERTIYASNLYDSAVFEQNGELTAVGAPQVVKPYWEEPDKKTTITYQLNPQNRTQLFRLKIGLDGGFEEADGIQGGFQAHDIGISNIRLVKISGDGVKEVQEVENNKLENGNFATVTNNQPSGWTVVGVQPLTVQNRLDFYMEENSESAVIRQSDISLYPNCTYQLSFDGSSTIDRSLYAKVISKDGAEVVIKPQAEGTTGTGEPKEITAGNNQTVSYTIVTGNTVGEKPNINVDVELCVEGTGQAHTVGISNAVLKLIKGNEPYVISNGCAAYASSGDASLGFDGKMNTRWESDHGNATDWIYVDLGALASVSMLDIRWEAASAKTYDIQFSTDEETWNTVYTSPIKNQQGARKDIIDLSDISQQTRYVRMNCYTKNSTYGYSFFEMKVYGTGGVAVPPTVKGINLAKNKEVLASGIDEGWGNYISGTNQINPASLNGIKAENAVDGNASTNWYVNQTAHQWLMVDLGKQSEIGSVSIDWGKDAARFYEIQVYQGKGEPQFEHYTVDGKTKEDDAFYPYRNRSAGDDEKNWIPVYRNIAGRTGTIDIPLYIEDIRYIRIYGYASNNQEGFKLNEFEVYEYQEEDKKVTYDLSETPLPELTVVHTKDAKGNEQPSSYVEDDMYIAQAKRPIYRTDDYGVDEYGNRKPIASNDWWQSLLINRFGNMMVTLPYKAGYSVQGLGILTASAGWLNDVNTVYPDTTTHPESVVDFYLQADGMVPGNMEDRVAANGDYSVVTQLWDTKKVGMTNTIVKGSPYIFADFTNTEKDADPDDGKKVNLYSSSIDAITDMDGKDILQDGTGWMTTDHFYMTVKDTDCKQIAGQDTRYAYNTYCVCLPENTKVKRSGSKIKIEFAGEDRYLSVGTLIENTKEQRELFYKHGYAFAKDTKVTYVFDEEGSNDITTKYEVTTELKRTDGDFSSETLQGLLPHQWKKLVDEKGNRINKNTLNIGSYTTARGNLKLRIGNVFYTRDKFLGIMPTLAIPQNTESENPEEQVYDSSVLMNYLNLLYEHYRESYEKGTLPGADAYWQGKSVHPVATGALVADMIGNGELKEKFLGMLRQIYDDWFTYDENKKDANGNPIDDEIFLFHDKEWGTIYYGASEFLANTGITDHHFTYGYMVFGAVVLATYDKQFYNDHKEIIEMMVRDYASPYEDDEMFCRFRNYDPYEGHSWAGGYADNNNGNNQEAAGESLFGWVSEYLWGTLTGNKELRDAGAYGFTTEMYAIKNYWFNYFTDADADEGGNWLHDEINGTWGFKIIGQAYAANNFFGTFFNGNPICVYGIHWLPLSEFLTYYGIENDAIEEMYDGLHQDTEKWRENWMQETLSSTQKLESNVSSADIRSISTADEQYDAAQKGYQENFGGYIKNVLKMTYPQYVVSRKKDQYKEELVNGSYDDNIKITTTYTAYKKNHPNASYEDFVEAHEDTFVEMFLRKDLLNGKIPGEDEYWQHITWTLESQFNPQAALKKYNANPSMMQEEDRFNAYIFMNSMDDIGARTDEVWAGGGVSSGVYKKNGTYTAMVWNPTTEPLNVTFYNKDGELGNATIAATSLVRLDPTKKNQTQVARPEISVATGEYDDTQYVTLSCEDKEAALYYTTDGKTPTKQSAKYNQEKIPVSSTTTVSVVAVKEGAIDSPIVTSTITISAEPITGTKNLAWKQPIVVSSVSGQDKKGDRVVDGDYGTGWESQLGKEEPEYVYVDLGKVQYISQVKTFWEAARATALEIQTTVAHPEQDESWTTVYSTESAGQNDIYVLENVQARYVKILCKEKAMPQYGYHLYELEVYGAKHVETPKIASMVEGKNKVYTITSGTKGVEIRYTTDGSEPTEESPLYTPGMKLPKETIVTARAFKKGMIPSLAYTEGADNWTSGKELDDPIATPTFSIESGTYDDTQYITLECSEKGAQIYYTTDGSNPSADGKKYDGVPIVVARDTTIKAMAAKEGYLASDVGEAVYKIDSSIPYGTENLALDKQVTASSAAFTDGAAGNANNITDGNGNTRWQAEQSDKEEWIYVDLEKPYNISQVKLKWEAARAKEYKIMYSMTGNDDDWKQAGTNVTVDNNQQLEDTIVFEPVTAQYVKIQCVSRMMDYGSSIYEMEVYEAVQVAAPKITRVKSEGNYEYQVSCDTKAVEIHYTTDNSEPTVKSPLYTPNMVVAADTVITFKAFKKGMVPSESVRSDGDDVEETVKPGDVNMDGNITAIDALLALKENVKPGTLSEKQFAAADLDGDGIVTANEVLAILKQASGEKNEMRRK